MKLFLTTALVTSLAFIPESKALPDIHSANLFADAMADNTTLPSFASYPVRSEGQGVEKHSNLDLSSHPDAGRYRTKLSEGYQKGPNFAGHYTVVQIGCGTNCQDNWIIDSRSGKIVDRFPSMIYTKYELGSTLMIVNPLDEDMVQAYKGSPEAPIWPPIQIQYLNWQNDKFVPLLEEKWTNLAK